MKARTRWLLVAGGVLLLHALLLWGIGIYIAYWYIATTGCEDYGIACRTANPPMAKLGAVLGTTGLIGGAATMVWLMRYAAKAERPRGLVPATAVLILGITGWIAVLAIA